MGARQHVERLLEIAVVGERPAVGREQILVAGMGDGGLFEHSGGLRPLAVGAERLAIGQRRVGVLGIGAKAIAIGFRRALRIGIGRGVRLAGDRARDVGYGLAAAEARGNHCRHGRGHKKSGNTARRTHGQIDTRAKGIRAERASNKQLTLMSG
jgi:hypothetical protein